MIKKKFNTKEGYLNKLKDLMKTPIVESNEKLSSLLYQERSNGNVAFGIVRENGHYFIKTANKTGLLNENDFHYIGGFENKLEKFNSFADAQKRLKGKLYSINESFEDTSAEEDELMNKLQTAKETEDAEAEPEMGAEPMGDEMGGEDMGFPDSQNLNFSLIKESSKNL